MTESGHKMAEENIKVGDYIIIQRQKYMKLFKFTGLDSVAALGKEQVELKNINEQPYFTTFRMIPKTINKKRLISLEPCMDANGLKESISVAITESGADNRNLVSDHSAQLLSQDDLEKMRELGTSSSQILDHLVQNSKTFATKTEFSQEKFLKKKEKKYFEYLQIRRPNLRMIAEIMYRLDSDKILGLRMDALSQLISYSNISSTGNFLLYESGSNGLVSAALLNSMGANTESKLVHIHQGNVPQKQALLALNLPEEQMDRCIAVNLYSVLRQYYQKSGGLKRTLDDVDGNAIECPPAKIAKIENGNKDETDFTHSVEMANSEAIDPADSAVTDDVGESKPIPKWVLDNERACELFREKLDSLVIVAKEHPVAILNAFLPFIKPSRPVVVFSTSREILLEAFAELKGSGKVTGLRLTSNWCRMYQVLPNRTHPDVMMSGHSGFLLCGFTIE